MSQMRRHSSSIYDYRPKPTKLHLLDIKINLSGRQLTLGVIIGVCLSIITIILQSIAYSTPHWKEIVPNTDSLYVDNVDALIRKEVLVYFNSIHRFTRHSYGLFQRCEYSFRNSSKLIREQDKTFNRPLDICTKNFLPSFEDEQFNECHSLEYYRFCSKSNEKYFNIDTDYLRATFDILSNRNQMLDSSSICHCHYPKYIRTCQILGAIALAFLLLTTILFGIFPFLTTRDERLKVKCFGVLSSIFAMGFILINLLVVSSYREFESIEYLRGIERHYQSSQIYKLSEDVKYAIERFMSSINIQIGYSTRLAWIAFIFSIIDGILLMITCKITGDYQDIGALFAPVSTEISQGSNRTNDGEGQTSISPFVVIQNIAESQVPSSSSQQLSLPSSINIVITECDQEPPPPPPPPQTFPRPSCLKQSQALRAHFNDEQ